MRMDRPDDPSCFRVVIVPLPMAIHNGQQRFARCCQLLLYEKYSAAGKPPFGFGNSQL